MTKKNSILSSLVKVPSAVMVSVITLYQKSFSPDHGALKNRYPHGFCRYYPTCSEYSKQAFGKYGFLKGLVLSTWRVMRCNPWSKGGMDELK